MNIGRNMSRNGQDWTSRTLLDTPDTSDSDCPMIRRRMYRNGQECPLLVILDTSGPILLIPDILDLLDSDCPTFPDRINRN